MYNSAELEQIKQARAQRILREQAARYAAQLRFEQSTTSSKPNAAGLVVTLAIAGIAVYGLLGGIQWAQ